MNKSIVIVTTSHNKLGNTDQATGSWAEEIMAPYLAWKNAGLSVTLASMKGGPVPIDEASLGEPYRTAEVDTFYKDGAAASALQNTKALADVKPEDFDAIFIPGGHGVMYDMIEDAALQKFVATMYESGKVVASVCHGPAALCNVKLSDGSYLVANKKVTGFCNTEEEAVGKVQVVPWLLEDKLKEAGGQYSKVEDWHSYAITDGRLITGQNPQSSKEVARLTIDALGV